MANTIEDALLALSKMDTDHARVQNSVGFNGRDTEFGNSLADQIRAGLRLSPKQLAAGYKMLRTYKVQLERDHSIDWDAIPPPRTPQEHEQGPVEATLTIDERKAVLRSQFHAGLVDAVRAIPGRKYTGHDKAWTVPISGVSIPMLQDFLETFPWVKVIGSLEGLQDRFSDNVGASEATDATIDLPPLGGELMPFQKAGVAYAVKNNSVLIGDEMGLGKTVQALATLETRDAYPALIIVPAVVKLNWEREARKWLPDVRVTVLSGKQSEPINQSRVHDIVIVNYDLVDAWFDELSRVEWGAIVMDESHYLKNAKAKRTKAVKKLCKAVPLKLMLTGTAVLNRPVELVSQLDILGHLPVFGGYWSFVKRYCAARQGTFGWDMSGASNLEELHRVLRETCYVRRTKDMVLAELPEKRRVVVPIEMDDPKRYWDVSSDITEWFRRKVAADDEFMELLKTLNPEDAEYATVAEIEKREQKSRRAEALVKMGALKQTAAECKLSGVIDWIDEFLESGRKLVVFAHHKHIINALVSHFDSPFITGDVDLSARQAAVDRFQNDPDCKLIVCNILAAGVGITLTAASDVAFVELPWRPGDLDQAEDRVYARLNDLHGAIAWYLLAANTIEEDLAAILDEKRVVTTAALDGRQVESSTGILAMLFKSLEEKAA